MFDFIKRKKAKSAKRKAIKIGSASVERINAGLSSWRATSLEMRRTMMEDFFAERLVEIQATASLSFEEVAEIEALAAMKNWFASVADSMIPESENFIAQEDRDIMGVMGIENEIDKHLHRHIEEVSDVLESNINEMIDEAVRRHGDEPTPRGELFFGEMSLAEVSAYLGSRQTETTSAQNLISIHRRLFDIAMFDHGVSSEDRDVALKLNEAVVADIEASMRDNPEGLLAFREAVAVSEDQVQFFGVGSLHWITEEHFIEVTELIPFVVKPEYSDLLPTYLTMMEDEIVNDVRYEMLRQLIVARRERQGQSDLNVLQGLAELQDRSLDILLKSEELHLIRHPEKDLEATSRLMASIANATR